MPTSHRMLTQSQSSYTLNHKKKTSHRRQLPRTIIPQKVLTHPYIIGHYKTVTLFLILMRIIGDMCPAINLSPHVISRIRRVSHSIEMWTDNIHSLGTRRLRLYVYLAAAVEAYYASCGLKEKRCPLRKKEYPAAGTMEGVSSTTCGS